MGWNDPLDDLDSRKDMSAEDVMLSKTTAVNASAESRRRKLKR